MKQNNKNKKIKNFYYKVEGIIKKYNLLDKKNDKIVVGVSGGKDSLALLDVLKDLKYNISAFHIYLGIEKEKFSINSLKIVKNFCKSKKVDLYIFNLNNLISVENYKGPREKCSFCGLIKRYLITKFGRDFNFNAITTGHHFDDEISFIFSNLLNFNLEFLYRQGPFIEKENLPKKVKPFYEVKEKEIIEYCDLKKISYLTQNCPFSKRATQNYYKNLLNEIEKKKPGFKKSLLKNFLRKKDLIKINEKTNQCKICKMPTNNKICSFCKIFRLKKELNLKNLIEFYNFNDDSTGN